MNETKWKEADHEAFFISEEKTKESLAIAHLGDGRRTVHVPQTTDEQYMQLLTVVLQTSTVEGV